MYHMLIATLTEPYTDLTPTYLKGTNFFKVPKRFEPYVHSIEHITVRPRDRQRAQ